MNEDKYFTQPYQYKHRTDDHSPFDVVLERGCSELRKGNGLCYDCYSSALIDSMRGQTLNKALDFINHQVNLYENPLQFMKDLQDFWTEVDASAHNINYDVYYRYKLIIEQGIQQLSEPKKNEPIFQKVVWQRDPDLFYMLFSAMYEEGFFNIKKGSNDLKPVAETLYKAFQINPKIGNKEEHSFNTFHQNFKPTGSRQSDVRENVELRKKIVAFLKTLPE